MIDVAELVAQLAPAARAIVEGSAIAEDENKLRKLLGLDAKEQEATLRRHINMAIPWDVAVAWPGAARPSAAADQGHEQQVTATEEPAADEPPDPLDFEPEVQLDDDPSDGGSDDDAQDARPHVDEFAQEPVDPADLDHDDEAAGDLRDDDLDDEVVDPPEAIKAELEDADPEPRPRYDIQRWRVDALKPNEFNGALFPDSLSDDGIKVLAKDMEENGQLEPITIGQDGRIQNGERRWRGACSLGWDMVDVRVVPKKSPPQLLAFILSHATSSRQMSVREQARVYRATLDQLKECAGRGPGRPSQKPSSIDEDYLGPRAIQETAARRAGFTSVTLAERAEAIFTRGTDELQQLVLTGAMSITAAFAEIPKRKRSKSSSQSSESKPAEQSAASRSTKDESEAAEANEVGTAKVAPNTTSSSPTAEAAHAGAGAHEGEEVEELDDGVNTEETTDDETEHPDEVEDDEVEDKLEDDESVDFDSAIDLVCDHLDRVRQGSRGDRLSSHERYDQAREEAELTTITRSDARGTLGGSRRVM